MISSMSTQRRLHRQDFQMELKSSNRQSNYSSASSSCAMSSNAGDQNNSLTNDWKSQDFSVQEEAVQIPRECLISACVFAVSLSVGRCYLNNCRIFRQSLGSGVHCRHICGSNSTKLCGISSPKKMSQILLPMVNQQPSHLD